MASAAETKGIVLSYMDAKGIRYTDISDDEFQGILFEWSTDVIQGIRIQVFFDPAGDTIHLDTMLPLTIPEQKLAQALIEVNLCNRSYRWIDFYLDDDYTIMGEIDAVIEPGTVGDEILGLISRTLNICDDAYPRFMKLIWG